MSFEADPGGGHLAVHIDGEDLTDACAESCCSVEVAGVTNCVSGAFVLVTSPELG